MEKIEKEDLKRMFPNLLKEIEEGEHKVSIKSVRSNVETAEKYASTTTPDIIYYMKKCRNEREASEIIDYMEKRGEISHSYAKRLRTQLLQKGLKSFSQEKD